MKKTLYILLSLLLLTLKIQAQNLLNFNVLNMDDGLTDNTIQSITKDPEGFMWFGSSNGLNKYDGKTVKVFKISQQTNRPINRIVPLDSNLLLILSLNDLYIFNKRFEKFSPILFQEEKTDQGIIDFSLDTNNQCWTINKEGLYQIDLSEINITEYSDSIYLKKEKIEYPKKDFKVIYTDPNSNNTFLATYDGKVFSLDTNNKKVKHICTIPLEKEFSVYSLFYDMGQLWITTLEKGIFLYDMVSQKMQHWTSPNNGNSDQLSHNDVYQILPFDEGKYLALTWNGYTMFEQMNNNTYRLKAYHFPYSQYQYAETRMKTGFYDKEGLIWIGTEGGGILYADLREIFYKQYIQKHANEISSILMDNKDYIWLTTFHKGLMRSIEPFDLKRQLDFEKINIPQMKTETFLSGVSSPNNKLWFGTSEGTLMRIDPNEGKCLDYISLHHPLRLKTNIWSILSISEDEGYAGTESGLFYINWKRHESKFINWGSNIQESSSSIRAVAIDNSKRLWIGTYNGLVKLQYSGESSNTLYHEKDYEKNFNESIAYKEIRTLYKDSNNMLWIGYTGSGLAKLSLSENKIVNLYTTEDGLCSNFITAITEDENQYIWIGSNSGISRISKHLNSFYNYYISGSNRSVYAKHGLLFWGNHSMLTYFNPQMLNIDYTAQQGKVYFTDLEVNHIPVKINDTINNQVILKEALNYKKTVKLNYDNRNFAISFTNLSYLNKQQKYLYRLYPYQDNWIITNEANKISYDHVPAGEYTFQVKTIFQNQKVGPLCEMKFIITPHWSETVWFRLIITCIVFILIIMAIRYFYIKQKRKQHELKLEHELSIAKMERDQEIELRKERESFFTTTAHELRTPLTLIISPLQDLLNRINSSHPFYGKLSLILKYALGLQTQTDRLLYIQKIEAGMVKLQLSEININHLLDDIAQDFVILAQKQNINYEYKSIDNDIYIWGDREKLSSVIQNLISNSFKYTPTEGHIKVSLSKKEIDRQYFVCIEIEDSGCGIDPKIKETIFNSYETGNNTPLFSSSIGLGLKIAKSITEMHHGQILVNSEKGHGTTFFVYIPLGKEHFKTDEYCIVRTDEHIKNTDIVPTINVSEKQDSETNNYKRGYTVLIIEDNKDMRQYVSSIFQKSYKVLQAENGEIGLEMTIKHNPDIIISDVMMPVMDGLEFCSQLRSNQQIAQIPIIMLTAKSEDEDYIQASESGADDYIRKPFNPEVLLSKTKHLLKMRRQLKQIYTKALLNTPKQKTEEDTETNIDPFMQQIISCIEANISNSDFNAKQLADIMNMSQATLYRKLKKHTDLTAVELIRNMRMTQAALLLTNSEYSIVEIAERVGFNDLPTFRKHFTDMFGTSPSKYHESHSEKL